MSIFPVLTNPEDQERFTRRLEAFSDLVFGFSLSLLATRLTVPEDAREIFTPLRVIPFILTFSVICGMWLEHYRIFRHHFVARPLEVIVNFVFLFGLAVLPFAVQAFIQLHGGPETLGLYLGDFVLILSSLSFLRLRGLSQRRGDLDASERLQDWKRVVVQFSLAALMTLMITFIITRRLQIEHLLNYFAPAALVIVATLRLSIRRLPAFLRTTT